MIRLKEGVYTWSSFDWDRGFNLNGFLFGSEDRCVVVDPPPLSDDDRSYLESVALWPDTIVITNRDHVRDRDWWLKRRMMPTAMHEEEAGQVDFKIDQPLRDGDLVGPGLRAVHLPGKSSGEIALYWRERKLLLLGDALIGPQGRLRLATETKRGDIALLSRSLQKLSGLDFEMLLLTDGDPLLHGAKAAVESFVQAL